MSDHSVRVLRIAEIKPHSNADKLEIVPIEGYQAVVGKGQFQVGDLAYYIPPDSVVPDREEYAFLWGNAHFEGGTPVRKRRITAKKLRGEWSEGLLMPLLGPYVTKGLPGEAVIGKYADMLRVKEGDDVADFLGITHYDPPEPGETATAAKQPRHKTLKGWFFHILYWYKRRKDLREAKGPEGVPTYDVEALKRYPKVFQEGEQVHITEKIHGSNARYTFRRGLFGEGKMYAGSRNFWKAAGSSCAWRQALANNPGIEEWCRQHPGYVLYGELTPTQKGYNYGSNAVEFHLFDIRTPDGKWMDYEDGFWSWLASYKIKTVPILYRGLFNLDAAKRLVDGPSQVEGAKHIREGIVIKAQPERTERGVGRAQLKIVSNNFLSKEVA